jgi:scyllo-inositol 2-dehydrogenase (NADP+)
MNPIKVGILGLGRSGWSLHALGLENNPNYVIAAVADPDSARRTEAIERFGCVAYESPQQLIAESDVELVVVATPSHTHAPLSIEALKSGKNVLVEKPMATSLAEADEMVETAKQTGKVLSVYQIRRKSADFMKVREIVESGVLGPLHLIKFSTFSYSRRRDWQTLTKFGGGNLNNTGPHFIDQALVIAGGEWRNVFADMQHLVSAGDADDHLKLVFRGAGNVVVDIEISSVAAAPPPPHWTILGKYGSLSGTLKELTLRYYNPADAPERIAVEASPQDRSYEPPEELPWVEETITITPTDSCTLFYDNLFATIREGVPSPASGEEIRNMIALFDECRAQNPQLGSA